MNNAFIYLSWKYFNLIVKVHLALIYQTTPQKARKNRPILDKKLIIDKNRLPCYTI